MTASALQTNCPIFAIAGLRRVPSEHGHVGRSHQQQASVLHTLHRRVEEYGRAAVRVQVDGGKAFCWVLMFVH